MAPSRESDKTHSSIEPGATAARLPDVFSPLVQVDLAGLSHPGRVRTNNEDHFIISRFGRFLETLSTNIPEEMLPARSEESFYGMVVADGVGGGAAGEVASRTAIRTIVQLAATSPNWIFRPDEERLVQELLDRLKERIGQIHEALIQQARTDPALRGFGTTMTVALSVGNVLFLAHIGDSRAYLFREGRLQQLTRDHTLAQDLAEKGITTGHGVPVERLRHVLTQALTDHTRPVDPEVQSLGLEDGDRLLLCTNGLSDMVGDEAIGAALGAEKPSQEVSRLLVDQALEAGGTDNVTVIVASYAVSPDPQRRR